MKLSAQTSMAICALALCLFVGGWALTYPDYYDPKGMPYVMWKLGLTRIDPDRALSIMTHTNEPERLVLGKSEEELDRKFGYLTSVDNASPYLRGCYLSSAWNGKPVKFLRSSEWMVIFGDNRRATNLILVKGC